MGQFSNKQYFALWFILLVLGIITLELSSFAAEKFVRFSTTTLSGESFSVPDNLTSERNIIVLAFDHKEQKEINRWLRQLQPVSGATVYEIPVVADKYKPYRQAIELFMRRQLPGPEYQKNTLPFYGGKNKIQQQLGLADQDGIFVYLIDKEANILWQTKGTVSQQKITAIKSEVSKQLAANRAIN